MTFSEEEATHLQFLEYVTAPSARYMEVQPNISWSMRQILILWLTEVHADYQLRQETLYLTVNILDRFSSTRAIPSQQYQLLGLTCLWIAAKYEENHDRVPTLKTLGAACCHAYEKREFTAMEVLILQELQFLMGYPTPYMYLRHYLSACKGTMAFSLACYISELSLSLDFLIFSPQMIATSAMTLSLIVLERPWNCESALTECIRSLYQALQYPPKEVFNKYNQAIYHFASQYAHHWTLKQQSKTAIHSKAFQYQPLTPPHVYGF